MVKIKTKTHRKITTAYCQSQKERARSALSDEQVVSYLAGLLVVSGFAVAALPAS
jgi:hypothetical protein